MIRDDRDSHSDDMRVPQEAHILDLLADAGLCVSTLDVSLWKTFHRHTDSSHGMDSLCNPVACQCQLLFGLYAGCGDSPLTIPNVPSAMSLTIRYSPSLFHGASGSGGFTGTVLSIYYYQVEAK